MEMNGYVASAADALEALTSLSRLAGPAGTEPLKILVQTIQNAERRDAWKSQIIEELVRHCADGERFFEFNVSDQALALRPDFEVRFSTYRSPHHARTTYRFELVPK
ncbi:MAG: hypothetical protein EPN91_02150 [Salinibacterium sp.]|nr:MAG: hypothetical protein EPN91_02150 [Salinibacterium sp.]